MMRRLLVAGATALGLLAAPAAADAFCGFYVSGADAKLYNNATQVVMMREGKRTVLSMRNNYQGPTEAFAMVVPVPTVLSEETVKTLPESVFERVDKLGAPRLVEYWEEDPCHVVEYDKMVRRSMAVDESAVDDEGGAPEDLGVTIEAKFDVGEYNIVILSAKDSTGLDTWLKQEKYTIPDGAEPFLRPYVQGGWKFFVAKVDPEKVTFKDGQAMLSPLRFHYDSDDFQLPIRLGMMNANGKQDLIVNILAQNQRYEVANKENVTIPTNINVKDEVRNGFGEFYAALFDATLEKNPNSVITEYSWNAGSCDPCPEPPLQLDELATLGLDVLHAPIPEPGAKKPVEEAPRRIRDDYAYSMVLTRLHARYDANDMKDDLVFQAAPPIVGGREFLTDGNKLEEGSKPGHVNNFQGRYAIRHEWTGPIECENPVRGRWGGPPSGHTGPTGPKPATDLAFVKRGATQLPMVVAQDVPEIGLVAGKAVEGGKKEGGSKATPESPEPASNKKKGCGCRATGSGSAGGLFLTLLALVGLRRRRR